MVQLLALVYKKRIRQYLHMRRTETDLIMATDRMAEERIITGGKEGVNHITMAVKDIYTDSITNKRVQGSKVKFLKLNWTLQT